LVKKLSGIFRIRITPSHPVFVRILLHTISVTQFVHTKRKFMFPELPSQLNSQTIEIASVKKSKEARNSFALAASHQTECA
jgi:hypothetical protein